jgi:hypothetical protein
MLPMEDDLGDADRIAISAAVPIWMTSIIVEKRTDVKEIVDPAQQSAI